MSDVEKIHRDVANKIAEELAPVFSAYDICALGVMLADAFPVAPGWIACKSLPAERNDPVKKMLADALILAIDIAPKCNPQDPKLVYSGLERCPKDHPNCCGYCESFYALTEALVAYNAEAGKGGV